MRLFGWYIGREPEPRIVERDKVVYVDRVVLGTPAPITLYQATDAAYEARRYRNRTFYYGLCDPIIPVDEGQPAKWHGRYFRTCEQAFAECRGAKVDAVNGWLVGDQFVTGLHATPVTVQPKPKVAKGRK